MWGWCNIDFWLVDGVCLCGGWVFLLPVVGGWGCCFLCAGFAVVLGWVVGFDGIVVFWWWFVLV